MTKRIFTWISIFALAAAVGYGYEITERFRLGAVVESITYISNGPLAGKIAVQDGWSIYLHDPALGNYQKLFSVFDFGLTNIPRGIAYISQGNFSGHFLFSDETTPNSLKLVSEAGGLAGLVYPQGFSWSHPEGLTQITSGPDQGKIAMIANVPPTYAYHILIFRLDEVGGVIQAVLERDLPNISANLPLGITFLPTDYPNPSYAGMFAVSETTASSGTVAVINASGTRVATFPGQVNGEGLAYIPTEAAAGNLLLVDYPILNPVIRSLDGSSISPAPIPPVGLGLFGLQNFSWLKDRQQFFSIEWDGLDFNVPISLFSRPSAGAWRVDDHFRYTHLRVPRSITDRMIDGTYQLWGSVAPRPQICYVVDHLDSGFNLVSTTSLPAQYTGMSFGNLVYVPGETLADGRYVTTSQRVVYSFEPTFTAPAVVTDISGVVTNNIVRFCYDPDVRRFYALDGTYLRVFDTQWNPLDVFNLSDICAGPFGTIDKITSGPLKGCIAVLNRSDNEMVILNFEWDLAEDLLERLIREVQAAGLAGGLENSLVKKLENALKSAEKKQVVPAINQVEAFVNEVQAQSGKGIPVASAEAWMALAADVVRGLQQFL